MIRWSRWLGQSGWVQNVSLSPSIRVQRALQRARAGLGEHPRLRALRSFREDGLHDFGDDVAGLAHDDLVAGPHVLQANLVFVVQRRQPDSRPADEHGLEHCERCRLPRATDRHHDVAQGRHAFLGRELVGDRPPRGVARRAERLPLREIVDLDDDTVDLVGQRVALVLPAAAVLVDGLERVERADLGVHRQAELAEGVERLVVTREVEPALHLAELVTPDRELTRRRDLRILLAQRPRGRVARVGEEAIARLGLALVELVERGDGHVHLAAHLEHLGRSFEPMRQRLDRLHVRRDVLARASVSTRRGLHQTPVLVPHRHREAVDLELAHESHRPGAGRGQPALGSRAPRDELVEREGVVERHHRHAVGDRSEGR